MDKLKIYLEEIEKYQFLIGIVLMSIIISVFIFAKKNIQYSEYSFNLNSLQKIINPLMAATPHESRGGFSVIKAFPGKDGKFYLVTSNGGLYFTVTGTDYNSVTNFNQACSSMIDNNKYYTIIANPNNDNIYTAGGIVSSDTTPLYFSPDHTEPDVEDWLQDNIINTDGSLPPGAPWYYEYGGSAPAAAFCCFCYLKSNGEAFIEYSNSGAGGEFGQTTRINL